MLKVVSEMKGRTPDTLREAIMEVTPRDNEEVKEFLAFIFFQTGRVCERWSL